MIEETRLNAERGTLGKTIVLGVLERAKTEKQISQTRVQVIGDTGRDTLHSAIKANVQTGAEVFTDAHRGYNGLSDTFKHDFVDHAVKYVEGRVSTNRVENF